MLTAVALALPIGCTGSTHLAKPWADPMQYSTGLADTPYPPRDLAMFDAVNGRVLMWNDLIELASWANVIAISNIKDDANGVWMRDAVTEDTIAAFPPSAFLESSGDAAAVVAAIGSVPKDSRRILIHYYGMETLPDLSAAIRRAYPADRVLTLALIPSSARFLRNGDVRRADVVAYTAPQNVVLPSELQSDVPRAPADLKDRQ